MALTSRELLAATPSIINEDAHLQFIRSISGFQGSNLLKQPSESDWNSLKDFLITLYVDQKHTAKRLNNLMRKGGLKTSNKVIQNRLRKWGIHRYEKRKDQLIDQYISEHWSNQKKSWDPKLLGKLRRYCKEVKNKSTSQILFLQILSQTPPTENIAEKEQENLFHSTTYNEIDLNSWQVILPHRHEDMLPQDTTFFEDEQSNSAGRNGESDHFTSVDPVNHIEYDSIFDNVINEQINIDHLALTSEFSNTYSNSISSVDEDVIRSIISDPTTLQYDFTPLILQPDQFDNRLQKLAYLSRLFYTSKLNDHSLVLQKFANEVSNSASDFRDFSLIFEKNRKFWSQVKSSIYYLKNKDDRLARKELRNAMRLIPILCEYLPFSFIKDLYATLSPMNTKICPTIRSDLLSRFKQSTMIRKDSQHSFNEICCILCTEEMSDDWSEIILRAMLDETQLVIDFRNEELFELTRTLIRFYRRRKDFEAAERLAWSFINSSENFHGKTHFRTRLAWTEYLYILKDQGIDNIVLNIALDIDFRCRLDQGEDYPDDRGIYAMEDIAEIYEKMGRDNESIYWLKQASDAALERWGNQSSTRHIWDKLNDLQERRVTQTVGIDLSYI